MAWRLDLLAFTVDGRIYTSYKSVHNPFAMLSFWDELGTRKNLIVKSKWSNVIVGHPNLKTKLRIWQPIRSEGLMSANNLSLIQIQNFAIVFVSTANLPGNTKYGQGFLHKAISYANDNISNALQMNLQHALCFDTCLSCILILRPEGPSHLVLNIT